MSCSGEPASISAMYSIMYSKVMWLVRRSEANDMALRLAKELTGGTEVIAVDK